MARWRKQPCPAPDDLLIRPAGRDVCVEAHQQMQVNMQLCDGHTLAGTMESAPFVRVTFLSLMGALSPAAMPARIAFMS